MEKQNESIWTEIHNDFTDEETGITSIDAWTSEDDNEGGAVIATIDEMGVVTYKDERAKTNNFAQEAIKEAVERILEERQTLVDKVIEELKNDFAKGDYTVIQEILAFNVSTKILKASLPEEWEK